MSKSWKRIVPHTFEATDKFDILKICVTDYWDQDRILTKKLFRLKTCRQGVLQAQYEKFRCICNHFTLESGINIRVRLLIFEGFSRGYVVIKGGYFYWFFIFKKLFKNFWLSFPTLSRVTLLSHFNSKTISLWTRQSQLTIRSQMAWALKFSMLVVPKTNLTFYIQNC